MCNKKILIRKELINKDNELKDLGQRLEGLRARNQNLKIEKTKQIELITKEIMGDILSRSLWAHVVCIQLTYQIVNKIRVYPYIINIESSKTLQIMHKSCLGVDFIEQNNETFVNNLENNEEMIIDNAENCHKSSYFPHKYDFELE